RFRGIDAPIASETVAGYGSSIRLPRDFWREKPEKFSFFGVRFDVDQGDAALGKFERSAGQSRNDSREIRLVADQHQRFSVMPLKHRLQLTHPKSRRKQFVLSDLRLQI